MCYVYLSQYISVVLKFGANVPLVIMCCHCGVIYMLYQRTVAYHCCWCTTALFMWYYFTSVVFKYGIKVLLRTTLLLICHCSIYMVPWGKNIPLCCFCCTSTTRSDEQCTTFEQRNCTLIQEWYHKYTGYTVATMAPHQHNGAISILYWYATVRQYPM